MVVVGAERLAGHQPQTGGDDPDDSPEGGEAGELGTGHEVVFFRFWLTVWRLAIVMRSPG
jgi:hypothetical protein